MDSVVIFPKSVLVLIEDILLSKKLVVCYILFFPGFWKRLAGCLLVCNY